MREGTVQESNAGERKTAGTMASPKRHNRRGTVEDKGEREAEEDMLTNPEPRTNTVT